MIDLKNCTATRWEIEDLRHPIDGTFCTLPDPEPGHSIQLTEAGEQFVIPGCEIKVDRTGQGNLW